MRFIKMPLLLSAVLSFLLLIFFFWNTLAFTKSSEKIPVLIFHALSQVPAELNDITMSPEKFKSDMVALEDEGYTPIFFKDYTDAMLGNAKLPDKPIFITFDDGYESNYKYAYPILKELNMKATISIIGWSVGRSVNKDNTTPIFPHFTIQEAKEMYESGLIEIQCHSFDLHDETTERKGVDMFPGETESDYRKRFKDDTVKIKRLIESSVGNQVDVYSYPYGRYNPISESVLKELGFKYSLTVLNGISDLSNGSYLLNRINVPQRMSSEELIKTTNDYK
jgi:peptidoglycan/xylan/chitin deacetylase (PgdA/CDA1 family)